jgi:thiol-disulfide isomerase/thioredoxin
MIRTRSLSFTAAALLVAGATTAVCFSEAVSLTPAISSSLGDTAKKFTNAPLGTTLRPVSVLQSDKRWLTAVPGGTAGLRGKIIVVNFWTYSCINSLRALPYLRAWQARYGGKGLVVVGVHTPEFQFEHDAAKVRLATAQLGVRYPNLQDNDFNVWRDFANEGWPSFYFIDANGRMRDYRIGEGSYAASEQLIRKLLTEAGHDVSAIPLASVSGNGVEAQADWSSLGSPEAYLGYGKAVLFRSPGGIRKDFSSRYSPSSSLLLNSWDLAGDWTVGSEFATLNGSAGTLRFRFHARDAHLVLGGTADGRPVRFRVTLDGTAPGADHGIDVDADGWGEVKEDRLYQLVRQSHAVGDRTVTVTFGQPGVRAYVFTFG